MSRVELPVHTPASATAGETAAARDGRDWWRTAVIYEVYPRSFADANGDGIIIDTACPSEELDPAGT